MNRRNFLSTLGLTGVAGTFSLAAVGQTPKATTPMRPLEQIRTDWKSLLAPNAANVVASPQPPHKLANAEWRKVLGRAR